jgi:hypothetical protein
LFSSVPLPSFKKKKKIKRGKKCKICKRNFFDLSYNFYLLADDKETLHYIEDNQSYLFASNRRRRRISQKKKKKKKKKKNTEPYQLDGKKDDLFVKSKYFAS